MSSYVHGYSSREAERLQDQASCLDDLLHHDSVFPENSKILEAGCGVGAQTRIIAPKNITCSFTSIDISEDSIETARKLTTAARITNVNFEVQDIFNLPYEEESFDHIVVCFVLEHMKDPVKVLESLKKLLIKGGTLTLIEGDHGSTYFYPRSESALKAIDCQVKLQADNGGNALIGRELYPLMMSAGFCGCKVSPRMVYVDSSRPELVEGFTKNTFTAMIEGVEKEALGKNLLSELEWKQGIKDLYRTSENDGVFCYTFFKGWGVKE